MSNTEPFALLADDEEDELLDQVIREKDLDQYDGLTQTTRRREQKAGRYPPFVQLAPHSIGLFKSQLREWQKARPLASNRPGPGRPAGKRVPA